MIWRATAYQTYIDLVTNQTKTVSSSFLQVYSFLSEAPDPYPLLEASVDSLLVADEILPKLEEENKHLQDATAKLTSQLDDVEKQLEDERKARLSLEETREARTNEIEASWSAVLTEKQDNWDAQRRKLEEKTENQERLLKELKASYEVSQRMDRSEETVNSAFQGSATAAELEIATADLERVNLRLAEVEARNEQLRLDLAQSTTQRSVNRLPSPIEDDPAYLRLRSENSSLLRKIDAAKFGRESERRNLESNVRSLEKEIRALREDSVGLRAKVQKWSDYENVSRELEVLKSIEFSTGYNDEVADDQQQTAHGSSPKKGNESAAKDTGSNLEQLLLARNKKLNNELTVLRVSHQNLASRLETLQDDLSNTNMELEKSKTLTATLENDLSRVQQDVSSPPPPMSVAGTYSSKYPSSTFPRRGRAPSPTSSIISGFDGLQNFSSNLDAIRAGDAVGGGSGMLPMIIAQRDRFKKRNSELETELSKSYKSVSSLRSEVASLQKDNLNLYEKTRYVSTYSRNQPTSSSSAYATNPNPSSIQIADNDVPLDRYRSTYESNLSPFAAFRGRESARAFKRMTLPERVVFQITRMILSTRVSRNIFALYCLGLHLLVFGMMYYTSTIGIVKHATYVADKTATIVGAVRAAAANRDNT